MIYLHPYSSVHVMITTSGSPTVGEMYTLECSVFGSMDQPTIIWLDDDSSEITSSDSTRMVSTLTTMNPGGSHSSTLTFNPLSASDIGMFMCRVTLGDVIQTISMDITVKGTKCNV